MALSSTASIGEAPGADTERTPGFVALSWSGVTIPVPNLQAALATAGVRAPVYTQCGTLRTVTWGVDAAGFPGGRPLVLSRTRRRHERELGPQDVRRLLTRPEDGLAEVLPSFAAVDHVDDTTVVAAADVLGFRHLYYGVGHGFAVLSTSARVVAACLGSTLDREALAIQSLLGWQVGQRTLFEGVQKLAPGAIATLSDGRIALRSFAPPPPELGRDLDTAVSAAALVLRRYLDAFLDDHSDAVLQLTGGQDSRLLLSSIDPARRRGLRVLTLGLPGNPDVVIAGELARRYGMRHEVITIDGLDELTPEEADHRCLHAAERLECTADPLAEAVLGFAEAQAEPGTRLSGLGGEVARGFYYFGRVRTVPVTRERVQRLAQWRMFANESVAADALDPEFGAWARRFAIGELFASASARGRDWMTATDDLYLEQRMQRWAGVTATAVCLERTVMNPMLDDRFIAITRGLAPSDKANSLFLSRLQVELDPELAGIPLEGRPEPSAYATRSVANSTRQMATTMGKFARKARQRATRANRPPAGGQILAGKVVEHWRSHPELLDGVRRAGVFRADWIDAVVAGTAEPAPSAVALMINLRAAQRRASAGSVPPAGAPRTGG